jgi:hypothetical protein
MFSAISASLRSLRETSSALPASSAGESSEALFLTMIHTMDRTLESTLLHVMKLRMLQDFPRQINACLDVLSEEELWWRPNEHANSTANLVLHLAASNRYYFEEILAGRSAARDRDAEFAMRGGQSKAEIRATWDAASSAVATVLNALEPS